MKLDGKPLDAPPELRQYVVTECQNFLKEYEALHSGRTAGWVSGVGLASMVKAIVTDACELFPCSVILDGEYGRKGFSAGVPAIISEEGVKEVVELPLPEDETASLKAAFDYLEETAKMVRQIVADGEKQAAKA